MGKHSPVSATVCCDGRTCRPDASVIRGITTGFPRSWLAPMVNHWQAAVLTRRLNLQNMDSEELDRLAILRVLEITNSKWRIISSSNPSIVPNPKYPCCLSSANVAAPQYTPALSVPVVIETFTAAYLLTGCINAPQNLPSRGRAQCRSVNRI